MKRPYAAVGHPAMPAYYDLASVSKLRGERYLVESGIKGFYVLRTAPVADENKPLQMQVTMLDYNNFLGHIGIGRILNGSITKAQSIVMIKHNGTKIAAKAVKIEKFLGIISERNNLQ